MNENCCVGRRPRLLFTDSENNVLLDTDCIDLKYDNDGMWFFSDLKGLNSVRYSEYTTANDTDKPFMFPHEMPTPAKLVARAWANPVQHIYYVNQPEHNNDLKLVLDSRLAATIEDDTITFTSDGIAYPPSKDELSLLTLNNVYPDSNHNINLNGDQGCIVITALDDSGFISDNNTYATAQPHTVNIRNDCKECCACEDYAYWMDEINRLTQVHDYEVEYLKYLTDYYKILQEQYNHLVDLRLGELLKIECIPQQAQTTIGFSVSNPSNQSLYNVKTYLNLSSGGTGCFVKRIHCRDIVGVCQVYPDLEWTIPELKAHSTWSGAVTVCCDQCGNTMNASWYAEIPWVKDPVSCVSYMKCGTFTHEDTLIDVPIDKTVEVELPVEPSKSGIPQYTIRRNDLQDNNRVLSSGISSNVVTPTYHIDIVSDTYSPIKPLLNCGGGENNYNSWNVVRPIQIRINKLSTGYADGNLHLKLLHGVQNCAECFTNVMYHFYNRVTPAMIDITNSANSEFVYNNNIYIEYHEKLNETCSCILCNRADYDNCKIYLRAELYYNNKRIRIGEITFGASPWTPLCVN